MQITPSEDTLAKESSSLTQAAWGRSKTLKQLQAQQEYYSSSTAGRMPGAQPGLAVEQSLMSESIPTRNPNTS